MESRSVEDLKAEIVSLRDGINWFKNNRDDERARLNYLIEQLEIMRRISERGLKFSQAQDNDSIYIDLWQHQLDEVNRTLDIAQKNL